MPSSTTGQGPTDPSDVIRAYVEAANAGDVEAALACWADDATYTVVPAAFTGQSVFTGKAQIRSLLEAFVAQHSRTEIMDLHVDGARVTAQARSGVDSVRRLGINALEATAEAIVRDGKIQSATYTFSPEAAALLATARAAQTATAQIPQAEERIGGGLTGGPDDVVPHQASG
jgi:ketosteroid isomerase-like protein